MNIVEIDNSTLKKLSPLLNKYKFKNFYSCGEILNEEKVDYFLRKLSKIKKNGRIIAIEIKDKIRAFGWIELSDWDTRHFGFKMAKAGLVSQSGYSDDKKYASILLNEIEMYCIGQQIKHITIRLPLNQISLIHAAEENDYLLMAQANAYIKSLRNYAIETCNSSIRLRFCQPADLKKLREITEKSFRPRSGWFDRFHNDPMLSDEKADLLYKEWINNCYKNYLKKANNKIIVATYKAKVVGYLSGELDSEATKSFGKKVAYITLNAVDEAYRRRGIYGLLVQEVLNWFKEKNVDLVHILTQSGTIGVQKVWIKQKDVSSETQCVYHKYLGKTNRKI
ncbi:MAG: GNAT family N-acetyltransferase [Candidatus Omnitrophica bacterium]|nr:GNAT family N-acetyltransferase [Candidatus Omnitrophota bacterium]